MKDQFLEGTWSSEGYHCIRLGPPSASVRALEVVGSMIWAAYKNCIIVIDVDTLNVEVKKKSNKNK